MSVNKGAVTRAALAVLAVLFWPVVGTTHAWVFTALMLAAIRRDAARSREVVL